MLLKGEETLVAHNRRHAIEKLTIHHIGNGCKVGKNRNRGLIGIFIPEWGLLEGRDLMKA